MKLWAGRFTKGTNELANHFHSSISFDQRMYKEDVMGSIAHCKMLGKQEIISKEDADLIVVTLQEILNDIENNEIAFDENMEDIHMNIESILIERIGDVGKKLHTGRSRNDQVALDFRMYCKKEVIEITNYLVTLIEVLNDLSSENLDVLMAGYTHLQKAQPVTFAHHLLAYVEMFKRDISRLEDAYKRLDVMPLGSGALAGTTYNLDREYVADLLGFSKVTINSLDGVSDRDFVIEILSDLSITMVHLSRFCEDIVLWSSDEFKFIRLDDAFSTGSSIMPQKKNPDMAELIRGKSGRVFGDLFTMLTVMKGLPLAYNKDMQEDKECLFDAIDTLKLCLPVFSDMMKTVVVNENEMKKGLLGGYINATDIADWLVKNNVSFRDAHEIVGKAVLYAIENDKMLEELTIEEYKQFSSVITDDIYNAIDIVNCVEDRDVIGGPSKKRNVLVVEENRKYIKSKK